MAPVQLAVYDLSRGLASQFSLPLTGKQIDGIWHTAVVVWGREIFYGQGVMEARPGTTHHGQPLRTLNMGETHIDEETFNEYLTALKDHYTADKYHLLSFNCNSFTQDVVGFLTGNTIPEYISNLPTEFLSTPFGQSMLPQINQMYTRGPSGSNTPSQTPSTAPTANGLASSLLSSIAQSAQSAPPTKINALTSPISIITNTTSFSGLLSSHSCSIVMFTNEATCPPCRVIRPVFDQLAERNSKSGKVGFGVVDLGVGNGQEVAGRESVRVTPTFVFYQDGKKVHEMKGASKGELTGAVEGHVELCYPPHPHRKVYLPTVSDLSPAPIFSSQTPNFTALMTKYKSLLPATASSSQITVLEKSVIPKLGGTTSTSSDVEVDKWMKDFESSSNQLLTLGKPEQAFPLVDLWRIALADDKVSAWMVVRLERPATRSESSLSRIMHLAQTAIEGKGDPKASRPMILTTLRMLQSAFIHLPLAQTLLSPLPTPEVKQTLKSILVDSLLHSDAGVRVAASGLAFNMVGVRHRWARRGKGSTGWVGGVEEEDALGEYDDEWDAEILSALLEGIGREEDGEVVYRLTAALALQIYLAPTFTDSTLPLLEALDAKQTLGAKLTSIASLKPEAKRLIREVVDKML